MHKTNLLLKSNTLDEKQNRRESDVHLSVDSSNDGCAHIHPSDKTVLKVAVEDESLQNGRKKHEESQRVTPPVRSILLLGERNQHPGRMKKGTIQW